MGVRVKNLYNKKNPFEFEKALFTSLLLVLIVGLLVLTIVTWINDIFLKINGIEWISAIISVVLMMFYICIENIKLDKATDYFISYLPIDEKEIKERNIKTKEEYIVVLNEILDQSKNKYRCRNCKIRVPKEIVLDSISIINEMFKPDINETKIIYYNFAKLINDGKNEEIIKNMIDNAILEENIKNKRKDIADQLNIKI